VAGRRCGDRCRGSGAESARIASTTRLDKAASASRVCTSPTLGSGAGVALRPKLHRGWPVAKREGMVGGNSVRSFGHRLQPNDGCVPCGAAYLAGTPRRETEQGQQSRAGLTPAPPEVTFQPATGELL